MTVSQDSIATSFTARLDAPEPLPELAAALRLGVEGIIGTWEERVRRLLPTVANLNSNDLRDNLQNILAGLADAMGASDPTQARTLAKESPSQGLTRFRQHYDISDLMTEDRLLRQVVLENTDAGLRRRTTLIEDVELNIGLDEMLQHSVIAFVNQQKGELRAAAEAELKYLSFLSHDLNNNLSSVTLYLQILRQQLETSTGSGTEAMATVDSIQQSILQTVGGMGRLLQAERLRKQGIEVKPGPVQLDILVSSVTRQFLHMAKMKTLNLSVEVTPDAIVDSDSELIALVLQNLIGNAVKYSSSGTIRIGSILRDGQWVLCVSDQGQGIANEQLDRIFEAFRRGEGHSQDGVGLGLAIASQATKLLGGELLVESEIGEGTTFQLLLPVKSNPKQAPKSDRI